MPQPTRLHILLAVATVWLSQSVSAGDWLDVRQVGHFRIRADFSLDAVPHLVTELKQLERDLTTLLQLPPASEPVHLLLFDTEDTYRRYIARYFRGAPPRRALFIKGSQPGWVLAYRNQHFEVDVRHESTHALLHSRLSDVPLWLDEGLAEYFEVAAEDREHRNPHQTMTKWSARISRVPDLRELEALREVPQMERSEYRAAWAWVHFMLHGPPAARPVLVQYLHDLQEQVPRQPLAERLEAAIPDLHSAFLRHHRQW